MNLFESMTLNFYIICVYTMRMINVEFKSQVTPTMHTHDTKSITLYRVYCKASKRASFKWIRPWPCPNNSNWTDTFAAYFPRTIFFLSVLYRIPHKRIHFYHWSDVDNVINFDCKYYTHAIFVDPNSICAIYAVRTRIYTCK